MIVRQIRRDNPQANLVADSFPDSFWVGKDVAHSRRRGEPTADLHFLFKLPASPAGVAAEETVLGPRTADEQVDGVLLHRHEELGVNLLLGELLLIVERDERTRHRPDDVDRFAANFGRLASAVAP